MNPFLRLCTSLYRPLAFGFAAFVFAAGLSVPVALALPGAGMAKGLPTVPYAIKSVMIDEGSREGLVKKVGLRLHIGYGGYGYPGGIYRYGRHRNYAGYNRYRRYAPSYRYRSYRRYRAYPRYRTRRHYRKSRFGRRHLRRHRHLRRFLRRRFR